MRTTTAQGTPPGISRRAMVLFGATLVPVLVAGPATAKAAPTAAPVRLTLPGPGGPYRRRIGTRSLHLVDRSRPARQVKNLPGRKTDVSDAAWLAQLGAHGLVRP
ncbi:hypothetical protein ABZS89_42790, partial [Streptomyces sp. NPDC005407]